MKQRKLVIKKKGRERKIRMTYRKRKEFEGSLEIKTKKQGKTQENTNSKTQV